jgi:glycosyl transferase family 87
VDLASSVQPASWERFVESRTTHLVAFALAVLGALAGAYIFVLHATTDPAADVHAYYEAGARLNAGQPLYDQAATVEGSHFYFYPPLLAVAFRPLALLPFEVAATIWMAVVVAALAGSVWLAGVRNRWTWYALGWLAAPIAWSLVIGQAHILVMYLLTLGTPFGLALAGSLKVFPALAAVYWLGRRDWPMLGRFVAWGLGLLALSFILEPSGTIAFLSFPNLELIGEVTNLSPYAISPALWTAMVAGLAIAALLLARTRFGWFMALLLSVLAAPRLHLYQFSSLFAIRRVPTASRDD